MVEFCFETVSCCLLQWMAGMDVDQHLKNLGQLFKVLLLSLQKSRKKHYD